MIEQALRGAAEDAAEGLQLVRRGVGAAALDAREFRLCQLRERGEFELREATFESEKFDATHEHTSGKKFRFTTLLPSLSRRAWWVLQFGQAFDQHINHIMAGQLLYIIHAADDRALARYLKGEFETVIPDLKAFVASKAGQIPTGSDWLAEIHDNLRAATSFLVLLTPRSIARPWVWYESGAAWRSGLPKFPVVAAGLDRNAIPFPLGAVQMLLLDDPEDAAQLFRDLGAQLDDSTAFCAAVRSLALPPPTAELDENRVREVQQAFGELGDPPKFILKRMLTVGGMTLSDMSKDLEQQRFVSDMPSVQRLLNALKDRHLVQGDFEGRWRVKPELEKTVQQCLEPPSLSTKMIQMADELKEWIGDGNGGIDMNFFDQRFRTRLKWLAEKAGREYAEGDSFLTSTPSSAGGVRNIIRALLEVSKRVP